ncbi:MAG: hypothetical protein QOG46_2364 [Pseudonocardiales bacterium]|nr:hypothetical protein [Pseudonocardiales bacterium]
MTRCRGRVRAHSTVALIAVAVIGLATAPAAFAGLGASAAPTFPSVVQVGQAGVAASIEVRSNNTAPNNGLPNTVCNFGDAFPCAAGEPGITLIPSCGQLGVASACVPAGFDPGVFTLPLTATGAAATACAGTIFDILMIDPAAGQLRFTPRAGHVILPSTGSACRVDFTFNVVKSPLRDQDPITPGVQTVQVVDNTQTQGVISAFGRGTSSGTTVQPATPAIATVASPDVVLGGALIDQATVSGRVNPIAGATVDFRLYGPDDATCAGAPVFESLGVTVSAGGTANSAAFTPTATGTYRWRASYSGDANNAAVTGACNAADETRSVIPPPPVPPPPPPPVAPPPPPPPATPPGSGVLGSTESSCTPPPGPAPAGGKLCEAGRAGIAGETGCQGSPFYVDVTGRQIARVVFTLDGKRVKSLTKRNHGRAFGLHITPRQSRIGAHRVLARVTFNESSGTRARTLRLVFQRCASAAAPAFTG